MLNKFNISHDRQVDRLPAQISSTDLSTVLGRDIPSRVQVGVDFKPTFMTLELGTRAAVVLGCVSTARASLRGISRVYRDHRTTPLLGLVLDKLTKLGEGPGMQPSLGRSFFLGLDSLSYVGEVFENNCPTSGGRLNDLFGQDVVAITTKSSLGPAQFLQMPFGRLGAPSLESSFQFEPTPVDSFPTSFAEELIVRGDGRLDESEINSQDMVDGNDLGVGNRDGNVHKPTSVTHNQIGRINLGPGIFFGIDRHLESQGLPSRGRGQAQGSGLPIDFERVDVVPHRAEIGVRAGNFPSPALQHQGAPDGFSGFDTGLDVMIADESWEFGSERTIEFVVQSNPVLFPMLPTTRAHGVENAGKLPTGFEQRRPLCISGFEIDNNCTAHMIMFPYIADKVNEKETAIPPSAKADGPLAEE